MSDAHRLVALASRLVAAADESGAATAHAYRVVVAWDAPAIQCWVAVIDATPPYAFATPELAEIDPQSWTAVKAFAPGAASEPREVAVIDDETAYVARRGARYLLRLDLASGAKMDAVDLVPRAPPAPLDGLPTDLELFATDLEIAVPARSIPAVGVLFGAHAIAALRPSDGWKW
jgi:hypothetical protein